MMTAAPHPSQNALLAALPPTELTRLLPDLELIDMPSGWAVYEAGRTPAHAYFPTTCILSLLHLLEDGASTEIAVCGNDGVIGYALFMGGESTSSQAVVISAGHGYRLPAGVLQLEFNESPQLRRLLLRYTQGLLTQMAQTAVCNRRHSVEQQLCRFLLLGLDRLTSNALSVTHELIANLLGVRREGVTEAAGRLRSAGVIRCARGHITVINRRRLEARVCECYPVVKRECDRLLTAWTGPRRRFAGVAVNASGVDAVP